MGNLGGSTAGGSGIDNSDSSSQKNTPYAMPGMGMRNPQSRKSVLEDEDTPNTDEFPQ